MSALSDRLEEVMAALQWDHGTLMRVTEQSSSVVSQWLGKGSKEIKTIGSIKAAVAIERASGYSAVWVATGEGPKKVPQAHHLAESPASYFTPAVVLDQMQGLLLRVPREKRAAVADTLAGWAREGGADHWRAMLLTLLNGGNGSSEKRKRAA